MEKSSEHSQRHPKFEDGCVWQPAPRSAQTTIPCRECKTPLTARRTCHHAYLTCANCAKEYEVQDVISDMDRALEEFLEAIDCDRV